MEKICKNCKYWTKDMYDNNKNKIGYCECNKFIYAPNDEFEIDGLMYWDYECYEAGFETGEKFGCIHFETKEE